MLPPYQERVIKEKQQLDERITRLRHFLDGDWSRNLDITEVSILYDQIEAMRRYSDILETRISRFTP